MSRLHVSINHVEFSTNDSTMFVIEIQQDKDEWEVRKSYSDFRHLREDIFKIMKDDRRYISHDTCSREFTREIQDIYFPSKRLFGSKKESVVKERALDLHHFLLKLLFLTHTYRKAQKQYYEVSPLPQLPKGHEQPPYASLIIFYTIREFLNPSHVQIEVTPYAQEQHVMKQIRTSQDQQQNKERIAVRHSAPHKERLQHIESPPGQVHTFMENDERNLQNGKFMNVPKQHQSPIKYSGSAPVTTTNLHHNSIDTQDIYQPKYVGVHMNPSAPISNHPSVRVTTEQTSQAVYQPNYVGANNNVNNPTTKNRINRAASEQLSQAVPQTTTWSNDMPNKLPHPMTSVPENIAVVRHNSNRSKFHDYTHGNATPVKQDINEPHIELNVRKMIAGGNAGSRPVSSDNIAAEKKSSLAFQDATDQNVEDYRRLKSQPVRPKTVSNPHEVASVRALAAAERLGKAEKLNGKPLMEKVQHNTAQSKRREINSKAPIYVPASPSTNNSQRQKSKQLEDSAPLSKESISTLAQHELEQFCSQYHAAMILRYIDRFISKAVMKTPGCYTIDERTHAIVIDSERFSEELETTFTDLPNDFSHLFMSIRTKEWVFPEKLNAYVQMKWKAFQGGSDHKNTGDQASDGSDDSDDSEIYIVQERGATRRKAKYANRSKIAQDVSDELEKMMSNGQVGGDLVLRLQRQKMEDGWGRRLNPGARAEKKIVDTNADAGDNSSDDSDDDDEPSPITPHTNWQRKHSTPDMVGRRDQFNAKNREKQVQYSKYHSTGGLV